MPRGRAPTEGTQRAHAARSRAAQKRSEGGTCQLVVGDRSCRAPPDTLVKIADILSVTLDELVGRTEPSDEVVIQNPRLHALYHEINRLSDEDQQALVILLDSLVKRSQLDHILAG